MYRYCEYFGLAHGYISDIALIELLNPIQFSSAVLPVCLDVSRYSEEFFRPGVPGKIAGFGRRSVTVSSPVLQTVKVTYVPNRECRAPYNPSRGSVVISDDEFCGIYSNGKLSRYSIVRRTQNHEENLFFFRKYDLRLGQRRWVCSAERGTVALDGYLHHGPQSAG